MLTKYWDRSTVIHNINSSRKKISGITTVSMSIAMVVAGMLTLASARYAINKFNESRGTLIGNQMQTMVDAVNAYITDHTGEISNKPTIVNDIAGYSNKFKPTASELKNAGYLGSGFNTIPMYGGSYEIRITKNTPCTLNCITGAVYLKNPIGVVNNTTVDIRILGAAMSASKTGQIGYAMPSSKDKITGPNWQVITPDSTQRAGILYATTSVLSNTEKNWLAPTTEKALLPSKGNINGDVRVAMNTQKPFMWDGTDWVELFSSDQNKRTLSIGQDSGPTTTTDNTYIGYHAGMGMDRINIANKNSINTGNENTMIGGSTGTYNTTGSSNVFVGLVAGNQNTTGSSNVFLGHLAGNKNTVGNKNIYIGSNSGSQLTSHTNNIILGNYNDNDSQTEIDNSQYNIFIGKNSGKNATGKQNIFIGSNSGSASTGDYNFFIGHQAGKSNKNGTENTFNGYASGYLNTSGSGNLYHGYYSGYSLNGDNNTAIGRNSGYTTSDTAILVSNITAIGSSANTEAQYATAIGYNSKAKSLQSTSIGSSAYVSSNAINSTAIGYSATATGVNSTAIGSDTQVSGANSVAIGNGTIVNTPNTVVIGNKDIQTVYIGSGNSELKTASVDKSSSVTLTSTGNIIATDNIKSNTITTTNITCSTCTPLPTGSDKRLKDHITDTPRDLSFIKKLRPVDYTLISNGKPQTGFIAQEVESADPDFPGIVKPQNDRDFYALTYTAFIPAIVKSIQQLDARLEKIAPAASATSATAPASVSGSANGAAPAPASADLSLLKWLVLFLSACVLSCLAVIVRFYKELQAMRLSVQRLHTLAG